MKFEEREKLSEKEAIELYQQGKLSGNEFATHLMFLRAQVEEKTKKTQVKEKENKSNKVLKYKLTLLKDLPSWKAGTEVINISQAEMDGTKDYKFRHFVPTQNYSEIYDLRNNPEWVKVEVDTRCDCETNDTVIIRDNVIGYGRKVFVNLDFRNKKIRTHYDHACDSGTDVDLTIKFCPLCGRKL